MFSQLIDGLRHIKNPLAVGSSVLLALWLALADQVPTQTEAAESGNDAVARIGRLAEAIGTGAAISLATFVAVIIGGVILQVLPAPSRLIERARLGIYPLNLRKPIEDDPQGGVAGVAQVKLLAGVGINRQTAPSLKLDAERLVADVERIDDEIETRVVLALALTLPIATAVVVGGAWFVLGLVVPVALLWDAALRGRSASIDLRTLIVRNQASADIAAFEASHAGELIRKRARGSSDTGVWSAFDRFLDLAMVYPEPETLPIAEVSGAVEAFRITDQPRIVGRKEGLVGLVQAWVVVKEVLGEPAREADALVVRMDSHGNERLVPALDPEVPFGDDQAASAEDDLE